VTIEPPILIAFIGAILSLIGLMVRAFMSGSVMSRNVVPREDYERQVAIVESYAVKFGEQTDAVKTLTTTVAKLATGRVSSKARS
jgi:hypothetical protein